MELKNFGKGFLRRLKSYETGHEIVTVLQVPALSPVYSDRTRGKRSCIELLLSKGADTNLCSPTELSLLTTVLGKRHLNQEDHAMSHSTWGDNQLYIDFLLAHNAKVDLHHYKVTPVQSAVEQALRILYGTQIGFSNACSVIRILLDNGASMNAVANDQANTEQIRHTCRLFFQQLIAPAVLQKEQEYTELTLWDRGPSPFYDTALRMLEKEKKEQISERLLRGGHLKKLEMLEDLQKSHGTKSLHLFPIKNLPGYVEEDLEEWHKLNAVPVSKD
jgi:hypothetical protein